MAELVCKYNLMVILQNMLYFLYFNATYLLDLFISISYEYDYRHLSKEEKREYNIPKNPDYFTTVNTSRSYNARNLLELLLGAKLVGMSTLLLSAVLGTGGKTCVAFTADHLLTVESLG